MEKNNQQTKIFKPIKLHANDVSKEDMTKEVKMQDMALKNLRKWLLSSLVVVVLSIIGIYCSYIANNMPSWVGIISIIIGVIFVLAVALISLGIKNGSKNVKKIRKFIQGIED